MKFLPKKSKKPSTKFIFEAEELDIEDTSTEEMPTADNIIHENGAVAAFQELLRIHGSAMKVAHALNNQSDEKPSYSQHHFHRPRY